MLILILTGINLLFLLGILFWIANKNCSHCQKEMKPKRVFTLKDKCQECERRKDD
ncbi:hypothetical protein [endosymbiont GvMRE of Glomus versiforme]|uniref:hypothetical protein n=1 Tax=endosymbiont GvMRE of Glomus versiforme TaxID=2039283 RepID=UPI000EE6D5B0|nr:hypothetical protein [endosymbiont GvMRE of Glomus versiforme]RHZ37274.1 hypothetical protein GvMRE_I1g455 [endosymbiont GvMRE of Glomus versiforme]RHZ37526.1 hypothetical protein GvMRE_I1g628 [endosymbiont GvMRE of Glomus versiforme]